MIPLKIHSTPEKELWKYGKTANKKHYHKGIYSKGASLFKQRRYQDGYHFGSGIVCLLHTAYDRQRPRYF
jgi:hypothetical protein